MLNNNSPCKKDHLRTHSELDILFPLNILTNGGTTVIGYNTSISRFSDRDAPLVSLHFRKLYKLAFYKYKKHIQRERERGPSPPENTTFKLCGEIVELLLFFFIILCFDNR